jgi:hypothetical protein
MRKIRIILFPLVLSVGCFILLLAIIFGTGQTFGQRCSKVYKKDTQEWCDCVDSLSNGKEINIKDNLIYEY